MRIHLNADTYFDTEQAVKAGDVIIHITGILVVDAGKEEGHGAVIAVQSFGVPLNELVGMLDKDNGNQS